MLPVCCVLAAVPCLWFVVCSLFVLFGLLFTVACGCCDDCWCCAVVGPSVCCLLLNVFRSLLVGCWLLFVVRCLVLLFAV